MSKYEINLFCNMITDIIRPSTGKDKEEEEDDDDII
jgi:hypothetical protein